VAGLKLDRATKDFGGPPVVDGVSFDIADGEFIAVLGPSGCGKTTILRLVAGFERLGGGTISIGGRAMSGPGLHVPPEDRRVGVVFQSYALWPHMDVAGNVAYPLRVAGIAEGEMRRRVDQALETVGLSGLGARRPADLSGGQRQRVALARCLVMEPSLVLLDEPLANLDTHLRGAMQREFDEYHRRTGTTMLYITHDQAEAMALADRVAVMSQGRLVQLAPPSRLYREPATRMVAEFIGHASVLDCDVLSATDAGRARARVLGIDCVLRAAPGEAPRRAAAACLRPDDLAFAPAAPGAGHATLRRVTYRGGSFALEAAPDAAPDATLRLVAPEPFALEPGARFSLEVRDGWIIPGG
jgi:iron(III) transport system ATP-binding protein